MSLFESFDTKKQERKHNFSRLFAVANREKRTILPPKIHNQTVLFSRETRWRISPASSCPRPRKSKIQLVGKLFFENSLFGMVFLALEAVELSKSGDLEGRVALTMPKTTLSASFFSSFFVFFGRRGGVFLRFSLAECGLFFESFYNGLASYLYWLDWVGVLAFRRRE